ncbi:lactate utilization protein [Desulfoprunum benzoelyticum]|uniref:L-lactate dehydrogenase complex protein LldG n=1 Tax=Desulfoprunum benzoelyticum TaxID=1506996 RepID=A0A840UPE7_9BACT|nr:lactate utilization protein [Desulfoprunum benzoelyticum]MBB5348127.1 L-lactate dehydrogenase complex protein LldG [Desulfoprunum benzoelyticum]MBM9530262.1 lactate utilization protein [Desulfoprunum benzoelyticum]
MTETLTAPDVDLTARFSDKARAVSAIVESVATLDAAFDYCVDLCGRHGACRITISGCDESLSPPADSLCDLKQGKIIAAPGLAPDQFAALAARCTDQGMTCLHSGMRDNLSGVDLGFTIAELGIAETGTLVITCPDEDLRLATMLCEYHVCMLRRSTIVADAFAAERRLLRYMRRTPDYTAFITGPSRTADIERVLALGVHGPLELHILVLED